VKAVKIAAMNTAIGIDLGGTHIKAVAIDANGNLLYEDFIPTSDGNDAIWKQSVADMVRKGCEQLKEDDVLIGISAPGLPDPSYRSVACMPERLHGLEGFDWTSFLQKDCFVLNDAVAAMMAESRFGAAKGCKDVVMITLGTGVGGAILINGQPYLGAFGKAGHMGHMVINDEDDPDICGMPGSLEEAIGNASLYKRSEGRFISTSELVTAFSNGDKEAKEIWLRSVRKLAVGLASITNILSPEVIVIGGGICAAGNDLFGPLEEYMSCFEWRAAGNKVSIVKAHFGNKSGAIGAACFAMEKRRRM
jgi:glucokinase